MLRLETDEPNYKRPTFFSRFPSEELDKIFKDRLPKHWLKHGKSSFCNNTLVENGSNFEGDHFSRLPDEILHSIMSSLTIKEAASMAILSSRWRNLWREALNLDFDIMDINGNDFLFPTTKQKELKFVSFVNKVLMMHKGERLESFRIRYFLGEEYSHDISKWIEFAIERKVQNLVVDLSNCQVHRLVNSDHYTFPCWKFSHGGKGSPFLKHLSVNSCQMGYRPDFSCLTSLTSLSLENLMVSQHDINSIFLNCLSLEWFSAKRCGLPFVLKIPGHCNQLKHLNLHDGFCDVEKIEIISGVNLVSLECDAEVLKHSNLGKTLQLKRLCFVDYFYTLCGLHYTLDGLASDFPRLETLFLSIPRIKDERIPKELPTFTELKQLVLIGCGSSQENHLRLTTLLLEASPFLHKLELHFCPTKGREVLKSVVKAPKEQYHHKHLEIVEIYGFHGYQSEVDLAAFILENAIVLQTMKIDRTERIYDGNGEWYTVNKCSEIKPSKIRSLLCREVPVAAKLIIL